MRERPVRRPEFLARQGSRPEGWLGSLLARFMRFETAPENDAALEALDPRTEDRYLEVGFGHARTLLHAARRVRITVGVDASPRMVRAAARRLRDRIAAGVAELHCSADPELPFPDAAFERILTVHTLYFWPHPEAHLTELRRVLAAGGRLVLGARPDSPATRAAFPAHVYRFYPRERTLAMLSTAGFEEVQVLADVARGVDLFVAGSRVGR